MTPDPDTLDVLVPNFKKRLSGVTATIVRLVPLQARAMALAAVSPDLPGHVPQIRLSQLLTMARRGPSGARVWHARRNTEMLAGLALKHVLRKRLKLLFTSASQRKHTGYTKWLIEQMDHVIATSQKTASYLERPADVILHGIDVATFTPPEDRAALRARLGLPDGVLIGCYGRIRAQKGTGDFVEAMIPVLEANPEAVGLVMGRATSEHGAYEAGLKERVAAAGLSDRLLFLPEVPVHEMADWYRVLDLFVAPQRWEGFGLTPLEAMACGVPCIATTVGAFPELLTEQTGTLVDPQDTLAMTAAITRYATDPALRQQQGGAARRHVEQNFRIEQEAEAILAVYRRLLA
ncbi:glycosyltransferase family 4 protein [Gymnodinialimonas ceratoperidinii]|uniref:Glycosyltransferase family 4 protein n=1 Tax=Gymnodinialimonas ceratoperidinii TaxID=2856823 RepID=A0A8F6TZ39_9RHOB|nr:glycosyltransferase family 4 protein [Gymnodinialimonas ceratoperidinii]QXT41340.1 glycosyltransferase family 4 protein [Gymnodinialimonas ceratoperidinii]